MYATLSSLRSGNSLSQLAYNGRAREMAQKHGLAIQNVCWEDTARTKGSCWGPNISDMTLTVDGVNMPAIRKPNFSDISCDVNPGDFSVTVGNETGSELQRIPFTDYLRNFEQYNSGVTLKGPLYEERDSQMLASAQACILPLKDGEVEFNVQLYNYQSFSDDSSVLVIVASSQGTSAQLILGGTQKLHFRLKDQKANFLAKRLAQDRAERGVSTNGEMTNEEQERNVLFIYQIPLKLQKEHRRNRGDVLLCSSGGALSLESACFEMNDCVINNSCVSESTMGMDNAVLRAGEGFGTWDKITQTLERDTRWPIRLTLQYYKVTDESTVNERDMQGISAQIEKIYNNASATGSLVTKTGDRPTEPQLQPAAANIGYVSPSVQKAKPMMPF